MRTTVLSDGSVSWGMSDALVFALIGIGVFLLLIPVSIRLLKDVLLEDHQEEPEAEPQYQQARSRERDGGNAAH